ncbi:UvrD-helicase domain-containing protein [Streptomyces griseoincarnatus]|uniref:DNA 3'-5' helicase n=1 Tax=Streptomyces griseoincarnatus TaxID=29305 RepID=A0ABT0VXA6_STRGI|nr:UvrD-helicase domain-containing protein [Streptomyces griseoincarnatus]MCM2515796.1 UvrD-helicase domain-containing protein [Streptomyces griseoincarnatus]
MTMKSPDTLSDRIRLTPEQVLAVGNAQRCLYIEAAPGSGKTTVSAQRFGLHRFTHTADHRAVVAVSFTRSATEEIRNRVLRYWGPSALAWPHRVATLDALLCDVLAHLLQIGALQWPEGHRELEVLDTWRSRLPTASRKLKPVLALNGTRIIAVSVQQSRAGSHPAPDDFLAAVDKGQCTHDNVREVLQLALQQPRTRASVASYLGSTIRSLIIDEIYDANDLDLRLIHLAIDTGIDLTLVGDPWQALYGFRGARPEQVSQLITHHRFARRDLHTSFRWSTSTQQMLAQRLRHGESTTLPIGRVQDADVVLARQWRTLWNTDTHVLPLAIKPLTGQFQGAACTLLLNEMTERSLGIQAVLLNDALITLGITNRDVLEQLRPHLHHTLEALAGTDSVRSIWRDFVNVLITELPVKSLITHDRVPLSGLQSLRARSQVRHDRLVPGLTCHQAKGREWDAVGVRLEESDVAALHTGLVLQVEEHRSLYVALTRARHLTIAL